MCDVKLADHAFSLIISQIATRRGGGFQVPGASETKNQSFHTIGSSKDCPFSPGIISQLATWQRRNPSSGWSCNEESNRVCHRKLTKAPRAFSPISRQHKNYVPVTSVTKKQKCLGDRKLNGPNILSHPPSSRGPCIAVPAHPLTDRNNGGKAENFKFHLPLLEREVVT